METQHNLFKIDNLGPGSPEVFETILTSEDLKIERIVTLEAYTEPGDWYDQEQDEWVALLQGTAEIEYASGEIVKLQAGDHLFIPAHKKHRVRRSGNSTPGIWLAVHGNFK